jgi:glucose-6-phosphate 1-dehydrogenase
VVKPGRPIARRLAPSAAGTSARALSIITRRDGVEAQWHLITPIEQAWAAETATPLPGYRAGSDGPAEADALLARNGHHWRAIADNVGAGAR